MVTSRTVQVCNSNNITRALDKAARLRTGESLIKSQQLIQRAAKARGFCLRTLYSVQVRESSTRPQGFCLRREKLRRRSTEGSLKAARAQTKLQGESR